MIDGLGGAALAKDDFLFATGCANRLTGLRSAAPAAS